jgi:hypothetical protein
LYGFTEGKAAAGVSFDEVKAAIHPDDRPDFESAFEHALINKSGPVVDYRVRGRDRRWRSVIASGRCLSDSEGRPAEYLGIVNATDPVIKHVRDSLDKLAGSTLEARKYAVADKRDLIARLLDMALMEVGFALAKRENEKRVMQ